MQLWWAEKTPKFWMVWFSQSSRLYCISLSEPSQSFKITLSFFLFHFFYQLKCVQFTVLTVTGHKPGGLKRKNGHFLSYFFSLYCSFKQYYVLDGMCFLRDFSHVDILICKQIFRKFLLSFPTLIKSSLCLITIFVILAW